MKQTSKTDLTNCDQEPIHIPGRIQSHGYLIAVNSDTGIIETCSENIKELTGKTPDSLFGKSIDTLNSSTRLSDKIQPGFSEGYFERINPYNIWFGDKGYFLIMHKVESSIILEFEPRQSDSDRITLQHIMKDALGVIQSATSKQQLLNYVAELVKNITGYTRTMVYMFHPDHHGEVVAEANQEGVDSWLQLHYPASDIPQQARQLYKLNLVRIIADVDSRSVGLVSAKEGPLDLTHSVLRAVSPVHIEYLQNMEVGASFSISLIFKDELWGLIACHNQTAKFIDYNSRMACKFIGQLFSAALEFKNNEEEDEEEKRFKKNQLSLSERMMKDLDPSGALTGKDINILSINNASGAVFFFENKMYQLGEVPAMEEVIRLVNWLKEEKVESFYQTSSLPLQYPAAASFENVASGIMAVVISPGMSDFIIWFKPEFVRTISWAGDQEKNVKREEDGSIRISPRKSFQKWTREMRFHSKEWSNSEISNSMQLRDDIKQFINRKAHGIRNHE